MLPPLGIRYPPFTNSDKLRTMLTLITLTLMVTSLASMVMATTPSLLFINSEKYGTFMRAKGKALNPAFAYRSENYTFCPCRTICMMDSGCTSFSVEQMGTDSQCLISSFDPTHHPSMLVNNVEATYTFWPASVPSLVYDLREEDNLLYLLPDMSLSQSDAREWCARIPGHRLAIFKKETQWPILQYYCQFNNGWNIVVDLKRNGSGVFWGDGTNAENTVNSRLVFESQSSQYSGNIFIMMPSDIERLAEMTYSSLPYQFICQANPFGLDW